MAAGLPPRKELTPEQKEEVQKHIYATQAYLDALQRVPSPNQNPSQVVKLPPPHQNASQYRSVTMEPPILNVYTKIPQPPDPDRVPPAIKGSGWNHKLPGDTGNEAHWVIKYALPWALSGALFGLISKILGG